jgi:iron complex transport system ATP-binding protein
MLEAAGVSVQLGGRTVLRDVSLSVRTGEVVVVVGPNGAGKSTLVSCLSGALRPSRGAVRLDGDAPADLTAAELARRRAALEQTPELGASFRLRELVGIMRPRSARTGLRTPA